MGRVQWDPERDLWSHDEKGKHFPRRLRRRTEERAIQVGMPKTDLSKFYHVDNAVLMKNVAEVVFVPGCAAEINERATHRK